MRLKKKYLAVIIALILVIVAVLSSFIYNQVQNVRVAYVSVHADKSVFTSEEDVTFELVPLTEGIQFTVNDYYGQSPGVHVVRIPDSVDPGEVVTNVSLIQQMSSWDRGYAIIPTGEFNSSGEHLKLSWNGTLELWNDLTASEMYVKATSGYYLLYPSLEFDYGHYARFMLDEGALFYYDSLDTNKSVTTDPYSWSISMDFSLGTGMAEGEYELISWYYPTSDDHNLTYVNRTFTLTAGQSYHLEIGPEEAYEYYALTYDALIKGPGGQMYAFGFYKNSYSMGWWNEFQY